ncbi:hypothetical protein D3C77_589650 [compost metagenome]
MHQRILFEKAADHLWQQRMRQSYRARHPQAPSRFTGHAGDRFISHFRFQQHRLAVAQVAFAHGCQLQLPSGALQQARPQTLFQLGNAPGQARLGNPEHASGRGKATGFDHPGEVEEVVEVLHGDHHCPVSRTN